MDNGLEKTCLGKHFGRVTPSSLLGILHALIEMKERGSLL